MSIISASRTQLCLDLYVGTYILIEDCLIYWVYLPIIVWFWVLGYIQCDICHVLYGSLHIVPNLKVISNKTTNLLGGCSIFLCRILGIGDILDVCTPVIFFQVILLSFVFSS